MKARALGFGHFFGVPWKKTRLELTIKSPALILLVRYQLGLKNCNYEVAGYAVRKFRGLVTARNGAQSKQNVAFIFDSVIWFFFQYISS